MRSRKIILALIASVLLFISACSPAYVPNVINTPMLSNQGEIQASVNTGFSGFDPQAAYALTDHIGIMASGSFADTESDTTDNFHKHRFAELGAGYYTKIQENGRFEVYTGYGSGKVNAEYQNELWHTGTDVNYGRFFIQPGIGVGTEYFDGSLAARMVRVNMEQDNEKVHAYFAEPAVTAKLGYRYVKAVIQFGLSIPFSEDVPFNYSPFLLSVGIQGNINRVFD